MHPVAGPAGFNTSPVVLFAVTVITKDRDDLELVGRLGFIRCYVLTLSWKFSAGQGLNGFLCHDMKSLRMSSLCNFQVCDRHGKSLNKVGSTVQSSLRSWQSSAIVICWEHQQRPDFPCFYFYTISCSLNSCLA